MPLKMKHVANTLPACCQQNILVETATSLLPHAELPQDSCWSHPSPSSSVMFGEKLHKLQVHQTRVNEDMRAVRPLGRGLVHQMVLQMQPPLFRGPWASGQPWAWRT